MALRAELEKILTLAIGREEGAHRFYLNLSKKVTNAFVKETFADLATDELNHKAMLLGLKADPALEKKVIPSPGDFRIAETEDVPEITENMKPKEAIALAMKKEDQAVRLYSTLGAAAADTDVKRLFENLANMELGHKRRLETVFVDIGYPEVF